MTQTVKMRYVRIHSRVPHTGPANRRVYLPRFTGRDGVLSHEERALYHEIDYVWFQENLPNPPFYDDDNPGKPITWFKTATAGFMIEKLQPLMDILDRHSVPYDVVYTNYPGRIVYEDEYQVAVYDE